MDDDVKFQVAMPLDSDGFLRRECPTCGDAFKWFHHGEGSADAEQVDQYFCPLCGQAAPIDAWTTQEQADFVVAAAAPELDDFIAHKMAELLNSVGTFSKVVPNREFGRDTPVPEPLIEPNDMIAIESPCHPNEPVKVPEGRESEAFCLICGEKFAT